MLQDYLRSVIQTKKKKTFMLLTFKINFFRNKTFYKISLVYIFDLFFYVILLFPRLYQLWDTLYIEFLERYLNIFKKRFNNFSLNSIFK